MVISKKRRVKRKKKKESTMREKYIVRIPIAKSLGAGLEEKPSRNLHHADYAVFGIVYGGDELEDYKHGHVLIGGPKRFRGDMLRALELFRCRSPKEVAVGGNKEKWAALNRTRRQWEEGLERMEALGWGLTETTRFRRLMS